MKLAACILVYLFIIGIWSLATHFTFKWNWYKQSKLTIYGLIIIWISVIFNIVYTGMLGWNFTPASDLESLLDAITFVLQMAGLIIWYVGMTKATIKK